MKAFSESLSAHAEWAGLILLFDGEVAVVQLRDSTFGRPDERNPTGILTPGLNLTPAFPIQLDQWLWEFVARYSGATVPDFHGVPKTSNCHTDEPAFIVFKERIGCRTSAGE